MTCAVVPGVLVLASLPAAEGALPGLSWTMLGLLAALGALLSLDDTALAQTWLSQPLPAGLLAGAACGDPLTGVAVGLPFQLVTLGNLPVGQSFTGEKVSATIAGVGGARLAGYTLPATLAPGAGTEGLLGWTLAGVCLLSLAGNKVVQLERSTHFVWMLEGHRTLWDGRVGRFERLQLRCLLATALRGLMLTAAWLALFVGLWLPIYERLPARVARACGFLPLLALPLAVAAIGDLIGWRNGWRWIAGGLALGLLAAWWM